MLSPGSLRTYSAGLALAVALIGGTPARLQTAETSAATAAAQSDVRIANFGQVNDRYYRGGQPRGDDFRALSALGIKLVIDLARDGDAGEEANVKAAGMQFVRIAMTTHQPPSAKVIAEFLALVNEPANQPVYVHCVGGRHRTGIMTAIYRMTMDGWPAAQAIAEMKRYGFGPDFLHPEFKRFVNNYMPPCAFSIAAAQAKPSCRP
jgi:protein tyrosine/serine phosphatase